MYSLSFTRHRLGGRLRGHVPARLLWVVFAACMVTSCGKEPPSSGADVVRPVKLLKVGLSETSATVRIPATVRGGRRVDLSFQVGGKIEKLQVLEGKKVEKDAVVARLDPLDFEAEVKTAEGQHERAKAALELARLEYDRVERIREKDAGAVSQAMVDQKRGAVSQGEAEVRSLAAAMEAAKLRLSYTELKAPFAGTIVKRYVDEFTDVRAKEPVVSLQDLEELEILADVPERFIAVAKRTEKTTHAEFAAAPAKPYPVTIKEVTAEADPRTQTYRVVFTMKAPDPDKEVRLLPGMTASIVGPRHDATAGERLTIPAVAVVSGDRGASFVWVVEGDPLKVSRRPIKAGDLTGEASITVLEGLKAGETIAVSGVTALREGMRVRPFDVSEL